MAISTITSASTQGVIASGTAFAAPIAQFNATTNGTTTMTVTSVLAGTLAVGQVVGINPTYPTITAQLTGTAGGAGTYTISAAVNAGTYNGTYIVAYDFLNVPSWAKRITVIYDSISNTGGYSFGNLLGTSSGVVTSGYTSTAIQNNGSTISASSQTTYFILTTLPYSNARYSGTSVFTLLGSNVWVQQSILADIYTGATVSTAAGRITLSGQLTTIRVLPSYSTGLDRFDNGSFNILYE